MIEVKDLLDELEKVNLQPIFVPALKLIDPIMGGLPKGSVQSLLSGESPTRENILKTVEEIAPQLPTLIQFLGTVAESAAMTSLFKGCVIILTPVLRVVTPISSGLILKAVNPTINLTRKIIPALTPIIKVLDGILKGEIFVEKGIKRLLPA